MADQGEFDLIVIGSGVGGLATALSAAKLGMKVLVLEKGDKLGGGTAVSHGGIWIGANHVGAAEGYSDTPAEALEYMRFVGGDQIDLEKTKAYIDRGDEALRFYAGCGIQFKTIPTTVDHYFPHGPGSKGAGRTLECKLISDNELGESWADAVFLPPNEIHEATAEESRGWGGMSNLARWDHELIAQRRAQKLRGRGHGFIVHFLKAALAAGVTVRRKAAVERLLMEEGRAAGVITREGETLRSRRGVVIATGGYESNPDLVKTYEGLPRWESMFPDTLTGDGLTMATEVGAAVDIIHNNMALFLGFVVPPREEGGIPFFRMAGITEMLIPHTMMVNRQGKRFADETYFQSVVPRLRDYDPATHELENLPCFLIFDSQFQKQYSFAGRPVGEDMPDWVAKADSFEALAAQLGIQGKELAQTAARFNQFAETGIDEDFHRGGKKWSLALKDKWDTSGQKNPSLGALSQAPFYGIELHPSAFCSAGLKTNVVGQVIHQRGMPIDGLYAVGNASGHRDYGVGYQAGYSLASGMIFGYLAAHHLHDDERTGT